MGIAKLGDTVRVHYRGFLTDDSVFDSSFDGDALEFTIGDHTLIAGFESAVIGMSVGDTKTVSILSKDGYGDYREDLLAAVDVNRLPPGLELEQGVVLELDSGQGEASFVAVKEISDSEVVLDANHPLAGKDLRFEIELVEIL